MRARAAVIKNAIAGVNRGGSAAPRNDAAGEAVGSLGARGSPNSGGQTIMQKADKMIAARVPRGSKVQGQRPGSGGWAVDSSMSDAGTQLYESRHTSRTR
jgi:hypothetical protein